MEIATFARLSSLVLTFMRSHSTIAVYCASQLYMSDPCSTRTVLCEANKCITFGAMPKPVTVKQHETTVRNMQIAGTVKTHSAQD